MVWGIIPYRLLRTLTTLFAVVILLMLLLPSSRYSYSFRTGLALGVWLEPSSSGYDPLVPDVHTASQTLRSEARDNRTHEKYMSSKVTEPVSPQLQVVIAHYAEDPFYVGRWLSSLRSISTIASLGTNVTLYTKAVDIDVERLQKNSTADHVSVLPNIGREGSTYLHHILSNWDHLAPFTLFTQAILRRGQQQGSDSTAGMLQPWLVARLEGNFDNNSGFMSLAYNHSICRCGHCYDMYNEDFYPLWPQLFGMIEGRVCRANEPSVISFNGQFIVSRKRIMARPKSLYEYLKEMVDAPDGDALHAEPEPKWFDVDRGLSRAEDPKFGHTLERLWHLIFGCGDVELVRDCDVDGLQTGGEGGCSCVDYQ